MTERGKVVTTSPSITISYSISDFFLLFDVMLTCVVGIIGGGVIDVESMVVSLMFSTVGVS